MQQTPRKSAKEKLAKRLKQLMVERKINRDEVAAGTKQLGMKVSARTIGYMTEGKDKPGETGNSNPTLENLVAVAAHFEIQVWELLFDPEVDMPRLVERGVVGRVYMDKAREEPKIGNNGEAIISPARRRGVR